MDTHLVKSAVRKKVAAMWQRAYMGHMIVLKYGYCGDIVIKNLIEDGTVNCLLERITELVQ